MNGDEIVSWIIQQRGYVVVGVRFAPFRIGEKLETVGRLPVSQPFVVVEETNEDDWKSQQAMVCKRFTKPSGIVDPCAGVPAIAYYRANTD